MRIVIADSNHKILSSIYDSTIRIPVKGDYVCYLLQIRPALVSEEMPARDGIVEKVMIDYVQDIAIVTVKDD